MTRRKGPRFVPMEDVPGPGLGPRGRELLALCVVGACVFALLSLATFQRAPLDAETIPRSGLTNLGGTVGYAVAWSLTYLLGLAAWVPCFGGALYGMLLFVGRPVDRLVLKVLGVVVLAAMIALLVAGPYGDAAPSRLAPWGPGGAFGANLSPKLHRAFGSSGRMLLLLFGAACAFLLATEWLLSTLLLRIGEWVDAGLRWMRGPRGLLALAGVRGRVDEDGEEGDEEQRDESPRGGFVALRSAWRRAVAAVRPSTVGSTVVDSDDEPIVDESELVSGDVEFEEPDEAEEEAEEDVEEEAEEDVELAEDDESAAIDESAEDEPEDAKEVDEEVVVVAPPPAPRRRKRRRAHRPPPPGGRQQGLPFDYPYPFPPIELFREPDDSDHDTTQKVLDANKAAIEQRLASFRVEARVVAASVGPAVTQYEVKLGEGIKLSKVTSFEADLAAALKAVSVRVVAPIPGKDTVGVEVPNTRRRMVVMRELLEQFGHAEDRAIPLFLGRDVAGEPIVEDMAKMPHLLIAGTTGSGKSVCINAILLSILMTRTPQQVRLILIDPKMVELQAYRRLPHLACDVVTNMKKAPAVLEWAVEEMERRYHLLSAVGVNHIKSYNKLGQEEIEQRLQKPIDSADTHLPYMVIVIDELADLMMVAQKDVEDSIQRLAQKSRAVGLHVILATQRPSTDVITGVIKANLPCQIAFKVNRKIDSRVILDSNGAEKLLGHGDMLYVSPSSHQMRRAQGAFVSEEETHRVVAYLEEHGPNAEYVPELVQKETAKKRGLSDRDELYEQAVEVILGQQRGSATLIQRALAVGYTRATRLLEMMEEDGVVGPFVGSKSREVRMTMDEWRARETAMEEELADLEAGDDDGAEDEFDEEDGEFAAETGDGGDGERA